MLKTSTLLCLKLLCVLLPAELSAAPAARILGGRDFNANLKHNVDFISPADAVREFGLAAGVQRSAVKYDILAPGASPTKYEALVSCSATRISDEGDLVTAAHCLDSCLQSSVEYEQFDVATFG